MSQKNDHSYLLKSYSQVDEYLSSNRQGSDDLPGIIISFCVVVERIFKMKLYKKNPILIYDSSKLKSDDLIAATALKKDVNINSINIQSTLNRFSIIFPKILSKGEDIAIREIYEIRNCYIHGSSSESKIIYDTEDLVKKMSTVWPQISTLAKQILGKDKIKGSKPHKTYSEMELRAVILEELKKKIDAGSRKHYLLTTDEYASYSFGRRCPRCKMKTFMRTDYSDNFLGLVNEVPVMSLFDGSIKVRESDVYKCTNCDLELTDKEYQLFLDELKDSVDDI